MLSNLSNDPGWSGAFHHWDPSLPASDSRVPEIGHVKNDAVRGNKLE